MRALVAEHTEKVGHCVSQILRNEGHIVEECWRGSDALRMVRQTGYDLLVVDALADLDGFEVSRETRKQGVLTPILMLGASKDVRDRVRGLDSGADDFMTKPFEVEEFVARVRALLRRRIDRRQLVCGELVIDRVDSSATLAGERLRCTAREQSERDRRPSLPPARQVRRPPLDDRDGSRQGISPSERAWRCSAGPARGRIWRAHSPSAPRRGRPDASGIPTPKKAK
jgi:CheY-like chemotaxis protein